MLSQLTSLLGLSPMNPDPQKPKVDGDERAFSDIFAKLGQTFDTGEERVSSDNAESDGEVVKNEATNADDDPVSEKNAEAVPVVTGDIADLFTGAETSGDLAKPIGNELQQNGLSVSPNGATADDLSYWQTKLSETRSSGTKPAEAKLGNPGVTDVSVGATSNANRQGNHAASNVSSLVDNAAPVSQKDIKLTDNVPSTPQRTNLDIKNQVAQPVVSDRISEERTARDRIAPFTPVSAGLRAVSGAKTFEIGATVGVETSGKLQGQDAFTTPAPRVETTNVKGVGRRLTYESEIPQVDSRAVQIKEASSSPEHPAAAAGKRSNMDQPPSILEQVNPALMERKVDMPVFRAQALGEMPASASKAKLIPLPEMQQGKGSPNLVPNQNLSLRKPFNAKEPGLAVVAQAVERQQGALMSTNLHWDTKPLHLDLDGSLSALDSSIRKGVVTKEAQPNKGYAPNAAAIMSIRHMNAAIPPDEMAQSPAKTVEEMMPDGPPRSGSISPSVDRAEGIASTQKTQPNLKSYAVANPSLLATQFLTQAQITSPVLADSFAESADAEISVLAASSEPRLVQSTHAPSIASPTPKSTPIAIVRQVAEGLSRLNDGTVELRLSPEELGPVRMNLVNSDQGLTIHIQAERSETLDLLRRHIDLLARDLADSGFDGASFQFGGGQQQANKGQITTTDSPQDDADTIPPALSVTADGVDMRV